MTIEAKFKIKNKNFILDVDFSIPSKGVTAIFGPSGCGKTTLLRAIAGLEPCRDAYLKVGDATWQQGRYCVPTHKRSLAYVFQEASLFPHLTVKGNLQYGMKRVPVSERKISLDRVIELLGIGALLERSADQLSGGERQRVAIARALSVSPRVLLMDEPLSALDLTRKREIMPYIESLHDELDIPVIYVSHSPDEVARLSDHLVLLENGQVTAQGATSEMLARLDLSLAHGEDAASLIHATVAEHDDEYNLTYLDFPGGRFTVARKALSVGLPVRLRLVARDVSITLEHQSGTSILNIFPSVVEDIISENTSEMIVKLSVGGVTLLSRVTRKSASLLKLKKGQAVYAQIKSIALLSGKH